VTQKDPRKLGQGFQEIGERLREERNRLKMTQLEFGLCGGVGNVAQYKYECGLRVPRADYLAKISQVGVDIYYVVTGIRVTQSGHMT